MYHSLPLIQFALICSRRFDPLVGTVSTQVPSLPQHKSHAASAFVLPAGVAQWIFLFFYCLLFHGLILDSQCWALSTHFFRFPVGLTIRGFY